MSVNLLVSDTLGGLVRQLALPVERIANPAPWRNSILPWDVNRSGTTDPLDALVLVNAFNKNPSGVLPTPRSSDSLDEPDVDVDGDGQLTPLDVLAVVNKINGTGASGEGFDSAAPAWQTQESFQASPTDTYFALYGTASDLSVEESLTGRRAPRARR